MKAHQRIVKEQRADEDRHNLFGAWWADVNVDIKSSEVREISYDMASKIILNYEYLGSMANTSHHYGIFFEGNLGGAVCYGNTLAGNAYIERLFDIQKDELFVLSRGACTHWSHPHSASKLIGQSLKMLIPKGARIVLAYTDPSAGEIGTVYQATNWFYIGEGRSRTCVIDKNGDIIHSRFFSQSGGVKAMEEYVKNNPKSKILHEKDQPKKGRYVYLLGAKEEKQELYEMLRTEIKPYPKRGKKCKK